MNLSKLTISRYIPGRLSGHFDRLLFSIAKLNKGRREIIYYYLLSMVEKLFYGTVIFYCARSIGILELDYFYIISAAQLLALLERIPISIAAIGAREGLFVALFLPYFDDPAIAVAVALVFRCGDIVLALLCMCFWIGAFDGDTAAKVKSIDRDMRLTTFNPIER